MRTNSWCVLFFLLLSTRLHGADSLPIGFVHFKEGKWVRVPSREIDKKSPYLSQGSELFAGDNLRVEGGIGKIRLVLFHQDSLWKRDCTKCSGLMKVPSGTVATGGALLFELIRGYLDPLRPTPVVFTAARSGSMAAGPRPALVEFGDRIDLSSALADIAPGRLTVTFTHQPPDGEGNGAKSADINWGQESSIAIKGLAHGIYAVEVKRGEQVLGGIAPIYISSKERFPYDSTSFQQAQKLEQHWRTQEAGVEPISHALYVKLFLALDAKARKAP